MLIQQNESEERSRFDANMLAFKRYQPEVYYFFVNYTAIRTQLVQNEALEYDLHTSEGAIYNGDARAFSFLEADRFLSQYSEGYPLDTVNPVSADNYTVPRFFNKVASHIIQSSPGASTLKSSVSVPEDIANQIANENADTDNVQKDKIGYHNGSTYPCMIVVGIGLGFHIERLLSRADILRLTIVEPDPERIYQSLCVMDWSGLMRFYHEQPGYELKFTVAKHIPNQEQLTVLIWNSAVEHSPFFPVNTLFYNHLNQPEVTQAINYVKQNAIVNLSSWGNYDDEVNQVNQALKNIQPGIDQLPSNTHLSQAGTNNAICIIGSGPSLDKNIHLLKSLQGTALIVSCGSAITTLYKQDIVPDIHCELESDYQLTVGTYEAISDPEYLKQITMIAPIQINPNVIPFFKNVIYMKREGGTAAEIGVGDFITLKYSAPTCTNLGLSVAFYYQFKNIFLFGLDFSFRNPENHHSKESVYFDHKADKSLNEANERANKRLFQINSMAGDLVWTRQDYYYAKWQVENAIAFYQRGYNCDIYNISDGLYINGTEPLDNELVENLIANRENVTDFVEKLLQNTNKLEIDTIGHESKEFVLMIGKFSRDIRRVLKTETVNMKTFLMLSSRIVAYLQNEVRESMSKLYPMVIGSIYHLIYIALTQLSLMKDDEPKFMAYVNYWKKAVTTFMEYLPSHIDTYFNHCSEELLHKSIRTSVEKDREIFNEWQAQQQ